MDIDDSFYDHSHGENCQCGGEFTLCGVACEEWGYVHIQPAQRITCPDCLALIKHCKTYKL